MTEELVSNRKARFDFEILQTYEAGLCLKGTEIKSLRDHGGNLQEAYALIEEGQMWLHKMHIAAYRFGNLHNHDETRRRKLLLHRKEIDQIKAKALLKGYALVPLSVYLVRGLAKVRLALAQGRKKFDKRQAIREREDKRKISASLKTLSK